MADELVYRSVQKLVRFWVKFFFKEVVVRNSEHMPEQGPLLLALNHPNNLLDSVLIASVTSRKIHFLATGQLFRNPILARIMRAVGAIAVYRQEDGGSQETAHQTFAQVAERLKEGAVVAIYPEGVTHSYPFLHKIKTGAARMALQAEQAAHFQLDLKIVPVGINFLVRKSFRRRVLINFGEPLTAFPVEVGLSEERTAVMMLTEKLQDALEDQILHIDRVELQPLIQDLEEIYKGYLSARLLAEGQTERAEDFTLSQRIIDAVHFYHQYLPEKFDELNEALQRYKRRRDYIAVPEAAFRSEQPRVNLSSALSPDIIIEGILGLPIFIYGAINHLFVYLLPRLFSHFGARKETDYATIRFLTSMILFPTFYSLQTIWCGYFFGVWWALLYLASLPFTGMYALRYQQGFSYFRHRIDLIFLFMSQHKMLKKIAQERADIIQQLNEARAQYLQAHPEISKQ